VATVREGLLFSNHNGCAWVRDLMLHGDRENRGVGRLGRPREIASTHGRRAYGGRQNIFLWTVNGCRGARSLAGFRIAIFDPLRAFRRIIWLPSAAQCGRASGRIIARVLSLSGVLTGEWSDAIR
jgi:hypothetical protein